MKPIYYLSGPMSGMPDYNFPAFAEAAAVLRGLGLAVISPHEFGSDIGTPWEDCLKRDLAVLFHCNRVVTLPGWNHSKGANLEVHVARELGYPVLNYQYLLREIREHGPE